MSAFNKKFFKDAYVEAGDTVYCLSCTTATHLDHRPDTKSYSIHPWTVTSVGRVYITAKPESGGQPVKFGLPPGVTPSLGTFLVQANPHGTQQDRLFLHQWQAEHYKALLEKWDAERAASGQN